MERISVITFGEWRVGVNSTHVVALKGDKRSKIKLDLFAEVGMKLFPDDLYTQIKSDIRYQNLYDRLMSKVFDLYQEKE